jgi:hypothetical protein
MSYSVQTALIVLMIVVVGVVVAFIVVPKR